jgi:hypothetical protein
MALGSRRRGASGALRARKDPPLFKDHSDATAFSREDAFNSARPLVTLRVIPARGTSPGPDPQIADRFPGPDRARHRAVGGRAAFAQALRVENRCGRRTRAARNALSRVRLVRSAGRSARRVPRPACRRVHCNRRRRSGNRSRQPRQAAQLLVPGARSSSLNRRSVRDPGACRRFDRIHRGDSPWERFPSTCPWPPVPWP